MRDALRTLIGEEAELLARLFCMMRRESFDQNLEIAEALAVQHRLTGERIPLLGTQFDDLVTIPGACGTCVATSAGICALFAAERFHLRNGLSDRIDAPWWAVWK